MNKVIKVKKGLDIPLQGGVTSEVKFDEKTIDYAIVPDDFPGYTWKSSVKVGDKVSAGSALLYAKEDERLCLTSPVAGEVTDIHRGERRKIEYISVRKSEEQTELSFDLTIDNGYDALLRSGMFAMLRQRPFDIVPFIGQKPRDIFVTAFDSAPLAPELVCECNINELEEGLKALSRFTDGKIYLSIKKGSNISSNVAEVVEFEGPHPAGNVGTQIAAISPINKGEIVWTLDAMTASRIGHLFTTGKVAYGTAVALTGEDMTNPHILMTRIGASLATTLAGEINGSNGTVRVISGNVLTGVKVDANSGFLRYPYRQITAIDEGDNADEFMGWISFSPKKYSVKRWFPAFLRGLHKPFHFDARIKGGHRAMILSGEYDKVFPMDIYPEYLLKAIIAKDIEKMEQLGIYEVAPEDFALAEFVDTSKIELQKLVREGLDYLRKETL